MKKCATIIFYSALFFLFSCTDSKKTASITDIQQSQFACDMSIKFDTINIYKKYAVEYAKEESPTLTIDINLPTIELGNKNATERIDSALALSIFDEPITLRESCDSFVSKQGKEFDWMYNFYTNIDEVEIPVGMMQHYYEITGDVISGYKGYLSYIVTREEYTGGAHPNTYHYILNFDTKTGDKLEFHDIFKEGCEEQLTAMLLEALMKQANVSTLDELRESGYLYFDMDMFIPNNFVLGNDGVRFLYNRYEIACYAMGDISITLDYKTLKDIMK